MMVSIRPGSADAVVGTTEIAETVPVAVYADDPVSLAGVRSQLRRQPGVELVDAVAGRAGAVAVLVAEKPDDATLSSLRRLARTDGTRAVLVATTVREAELLQVIESGVGAVVWRREATGSRLQQAVLAASRGNGDLPGDLLGRLMTQVGSMQRGTSGPADVPVHGLSAREVDVLRLVAEGMDTGEIASKLSYSERTVKNVMHGLTTRLQLRNRAHAVAYALREGYI